MLCTVESALSVPDHAEHRDASRERIGDGLPHERGGRAVVGDGASTRRRSSDRRRLERPIGRRRHVADDRVEQRLDADVQHRRRAQQREDLAGARRACEARDELFLRQRAGFEELLHQRIVGLGDHLDERFARGVRGLSRSREPLPSVSLPLPSAAKVMAFIATRSTTPR